MIRKAVEVDRLQPPRGPGIGRTTPPTWTASAGCCSGRGSWERRAIGSKRPRPCRKAPTTPRSGTISATSISSSTGPARWRDAWRNAVKLYDHDKRSRKEGRQDEAKRKLKMIAE